MDFVEIFNVSLDLSTIYFAHLVGAELPSCIVVVVVTLSHNAITCFQVEYKIVLFYFPTFA